MASEITRQAPFYSDLREKHIPVKGLSSGDILEYQFRSQLQKRPPKFVRFTNTLAQDSGTSESHLALDGTSLMRQGKFSATGMAIAKTSTLYLLRCSMRPG
jgi:uncharacterized protein DUF3857